MAPRGRFTALLLAGGRGLRLRPLTDTVPKPLLPVGGKRVVERLLEGLRQAGAGVVVVATGYKSEMIETHLGDGTAYGLRLVYQPEREPLGTAGPLGELQGRVAEPLVLVNGDIVTRLDFRSLYEFHLAQDADLTMAVTEYSWRLPYGAVELQGTRVLAIREKPEVIQLVSAGIYVVSPRVLGLVPRGRRFDMPQLIADLAPRERVAAYRFKEFWIDIGDARALERAAAEVARWDAALDGRAMSGADRPELHA